MVFACEGRACGSSNYWANTVFGTSRLYGPAEDQYYMLGRATDRYTMIYLARRGTGQAYAMVQSLQLDATNAVINQAEMVRALVQEGSYPIPLQPDEKAIASSVAALQQLAMDALVVVVVHGPQKPGESLADTLLRTTNEAETIRAMLESGGVAARMLDARGVGPLVPDRRGSRAELVLVAP